MMRGMCRNDYEVAQGYSVGYQVATDQGAGLKVLQVNVPRAKTGTNADLV